MIHLRCVSFPRRADPAELHRLFFALLCGSLLGALFSKCWVGTLPPSVLTQARQASVLAVWLRCALFPCLMAAALLLRSRPLFPALFFLRGFFASCTLCVFAASGLAYFLRVLPILLLERLLPLPLLLLLGAAWSADAEGGRQDLTALFPTLLLLLPGILLRALMIS